MWAAVMLAAGTAAGMLNASAGGLTELVPSLPARYSSEEAGRRPTVREQGGLGTCWALTAMSALEAAVLPKQRMVFSADHMVYQNAFAVPVEEGGTFQMTMAYLSGWQGPVLEEEDPYGDGSSPEGLSPAMHVQEIQVLEKPSREAIKKAVMQYGAVQTSMYFNKRAAKDHYMEATASYYEPEVRKPDHEILIVGWDDTYSRFLFRQPPEVDGAFLCQNTWGGAFGRDGLFYVSYADVNIGGTCLIYTDVQEPDSYRFIYQTDDCGWQGRQGYDTEDCWFANVYTAGEGSAGAALDAEKAEERAESADLTGMEKLNGTEEQTGSADLPGMEKMGEAEYLAAAGFYAVGPDTSYELYIVPDFEEEASFAKRQFVKAGRLEQAGYYTVNLDEPIWLERGKRFAVVVKIRTPGEGRPVAVEYRANEYTQNVTTEGKFGYLSENGRVWAHTEAQYGTNVCLKAYTR